MQLCTRPPFEGYALAVVVSALECESVGMRLSAHPLVRQIALLLVVGGLVFVLCGCGNGNAPKQEVLKSANLLSADLYVRVAGPTGVVNYIVGRLKSSAFDTYGHGVFLPPRVGHHLRHRVCSVTHRIVSADNASLQAWRGRKVRVEVYGDDKGSEAIFCQILPLVLARAS